MRPLLLAAAALAAAAPLLAQRRPAAAPALVVTDRWLADRLDRGDTSLVLLHVGARGEFDAGHIAGSRFVSLEQYAPANAADTLERELPTPEALRALLEPLGVADGRRVIVIGQPLPAARFAFTMAAMGREAMVSVLDGGVETWREAGRALVTEATPALDPARRGTLTLDPVAALVATTAEVARLSADTTADVAAASPRPVRRRGARPASRTRVVDARLPEFYAGTSQGGLPRSGHIPGARSVPLSSLAGAAGALRDTSAVRARFAAAGIAPRDTVVSYCFIGMQGSLLWLQARRLGHPARLYDASFTAWSRDRTLPVSTGLAPR